MAASSHQQLRPTNLSAVLDTGLAARLTARRNDAYVRTRGFVTESDKPAAWRGKYLHPEVFGRTPDEGIFFRASSRLVSPASPLVVFDPGMTPESLEVSQ